SAAGAEERGARLHRHGRERGAVEDPLPALAAPAVERPTGATRTADGGGHAIGGGAAQHDLGLRARGLSSRLARCFPGAASAGVLPVSRTRAAAATALG